MPTDLWRGNLDIFFNYLVVCLVLPFPACWFSWQLWHHRAAARPPGAAVGTAGGRGAGGLGRAVPDGSGVPGVKGSRCAAESGRG